VIVTANYKLTFDAVRSALSCLNLWLLVVDTRGINVWCAAGKGTFSAEEVAYQVQRTRLKEIVSHRQLILPQLAASGVTAMQLKQLCSFRAVFGPVRAADLPAFLGHSPVDEQEMRSVSFTLRERLVLVPVEICMLYKPMAMVLPAALLLSGIGPGLFSIKAVISRGGQFLLATFAAILAGAVLTPVALPWLPGRQFWLKGLLASCLAALLLSGRFLGTLGGMSALALGLWIIAAGSFLAMNFTGSTPYTSLSGVETEMRKGLPVQIVLATIAGLLWLIDPFLR